MTNTQRAFWSGPVGLMGALSGWRGEIWTSPSSQLPTNSTSADINPFYVGYRILSYRIGMIFSAQEIKETISYQTPILSNLGFYCSSVYGNMNLSNYSVKIGHTNLTSLKDDWGIAEKTLSNTNIKPVKNEWIFLGPFPESGDNSFTWDGIRNIYIDLSWRTGFQLQGSGGKSLRLSNPDPENEFHFIRSCSSNTASCSSSSWGKTRPSVVFKWKI